jgi:hypothetical protein
MCGSVATVISREGDGDWFSDDYFVCVTVDDGGNPLVVARYDDNRCCAIGDDPDNPGQF